VIGEVWIPHGSNTPAVCRKLIADWGEHEGTVRCYGDATGGARGTAQVAGSDWEIISREMRKHYGERAIMRVDRGNPPERARVNAVNTRLLNGAEEIHMIIDPAKAPKTVRDFEGVRVLEGGSGELDKSKKSEKDLTHHAKVNTPSLAHRAMTPLWDLSDALEGGTWKMRRAKETYLPRYDAESEAAYEKREALGAHKFLHARHQQYHRQALRQGMGAQ
jgi:hypothetical protein